MNRSTRTLACIVLSVAFIACRSRSTPSSDEHAGSAAAAIATKAPAEELPIECRRYHDLVAQLEQCSRLPLQLHDGIKRSYETIARNLASSAGSPEARAALDSACRQAAETFRRVSASYCER